MSNTEILTLLTAALLERAVGSSPTIEAGVANYQMAAHALITHLGITSLDQLASLNLVAVQSTDQGTYFYQAGDPMPIAARDFIAMHTQHEPMDFGPNEFSE